MSKKHKSQSSSVADSHDADKQRRNFLRHSISTAMGVTVSAAVIQTVASATESAGETDGVLKSEKKEGYQLTKHIADYYKSAAI